MVPTRPYVDADDVADKQQSTELVRIMITAMFSHVLWYRQVFPKHKVRYVFRTCNPTAPSTSYDAFMSGGLDKNTGLQLPDELKTWMVLPRDQHAGADKFLDRLETGVKEALENGSLSKLQLSFHSADNQSPSTKNLLESYTLGFAYADGIKLAEIAVEDQLSKAEKTPPSVGHIKGEMNYLHNQFHYLISALDAGRGASKQSLPGSFRMFLTMKYFGDEDFCPTGFHLGNGEHSILALIQDTPLNLNLQMVTGHHIVLAGVCLPELQPSQTCQGDEIGEQMTKSVAAKSTKMRQVSYRQQSGPVEDQTQLEAILQLQAMGKSRLDENDFNTQPMQSSVQHIAEAGPSFNYTQEVREYIEQSQLADRSESETNDSNRPYVCECNSGSCKVTPPSMETQDVVIKCQVCDGNRHLECYGYLKDVQLEAFVCYSCLESRFPAYKRQLAEAVSMCAKRRVLKYLITNGSVKAMKNLYTHLNTSSKTACEILSQLKSEGHVLGSDRRRKNRPDLFSLVEPRDKLMLEYFDPYKGIEPLMCTVNEPRLDDTPKALVNQVRITYPENATIADDGSTQGTPSPRTTYRLRAGDYPILTPMDKTTGFVGNDFAVTNKRKADNGVEVKPPKRPALPRIAFGSPMSLVRDR